MTTDNSIIHVVPVSDIYDHVEEGEGCPCKPETQHVTRMDGGDAYLIVHNSFDGREHAEPDHDKDNCPVCRNE